MIRYRSVLTITVLAGALFIVSCKQPAKNTEGVSTDVINNPATASGKPADPGSLPVMSFKEESFDFGKITQGEKVTHVFKFTNTGGSDLVISNAKPSCGCTVPDYQKEPVPAGGESQITVVFNSEGKSGKVTKTVTVVTNSSPNTKVLTITANIVVPEED